ncbi:hypothetical protein BOX15_Mlig030565g1 [Macrostomum lignano]|uniref:ANK_REP_REGION domain-containing protein n=2 Tax=Macrostomum lignano TaxID=282301 RepID=A0A1I8GQS1_9PLAT|nr:hypothetical protein BOX15_Mlig030565g1 [Macrostomum lignano]
MPGQPASDKGRSDNTGIAARHSSVRHRPLLPKQYSLAQQQHEQQQLQQHQQFSEEQQLRQEQLPKTPAAMDSKKPPGTRISIRINDSDDVVSGSTRRHVQYRRQELKQLRRQRFESASSNTGDSIDTGRDYSALQRRRNSRPVREVRTNRPPGFFRNLIIAPSISPSIKKKDDVIMTPLMQAYYNGELNKLESMLTGSNLYECHKCHQTLADIAAADGHLHVLDILHNRGVDFNKKNPGNYVPLHYAVESQQTRVMRKLVALGANPNIPLPSGEYPLHRACGFQTNDVLSCLLRICKADVDVSDRQGNSPLHRACLEDSTIHVKTLLEYCSQDVINLKGYEGKTALHIAVINQNRNITAMLLNNGAFVDIQSDSKKTVIDQVLGLGSVVLMSDLAYFFTQEMTKSEARSFSELFQDPQFQQYLNFLDAVDNEFQLCQIKYDELSRDEEAELLSKLEKDDKIDLIEFKDVVLKLLQTEAIHVLLDPGNKDVLLKTCSNIVRYVLFREDSVMLERIMNCGLIWFEIRAHIEEHIDELYVHTPNRGNNGIVSHLTNNFISDHRLDREAFTRFYGQKCSNFKLRAYREVEFQAQSDYMRHPMDTLVMWSIFTGRFKLTEILLRQEKFDVVPLGLYCASVLRAFATIPSMSVDAAEMEQLASTCELFAAQIVKNVYQLDTSFNKQTTVDYLLLRLPSYGDITCIQLAARNSSSKFLQTEAGQEALNKSWFGFLLHINTYVREVLIWLGLIPLNLFIPVILLYLEKKYTEKANKLDKNAELFQKDSAKTSGNPSCDFLLPESMRSAQENNPTPVMARRTRSSELRPLVRSREQLSQSMTTLNSMPEFVTKETENEETASSYSPDGPSIFSWEYIRLLFSLLYGFYRIPAVKFRYHAISHIILLLLLSYIVLLEFDYELSAPEVIAYTIIFGFLMEELAEFVQYLLLHETISDFFSSKWNIIDLLALLSAVIGFALRISRYDRSIPTHERSLEMAFDDTLWYNARLFLGTSCMLYWVRLLYISTVLEELGPKLKMIATMIIKDMMPFLFILFIFILGFGVLIHGLLFPNGYYAWNSDKMTTSEVLVAMFRICFYSMVGEYSLDLIEGDSECDDIYNNKTKNGKSCPHQFGRYLVPNLVMPLYVIITEILLLNLIIALFSRTIEEIDSRSKALWQFERHELIEEFQTRSCLPPPFNIFDIFRRVLGRNWRSYRRESRGAPQQSSDEKKELDKELVLQFLLYQAFSLRNNREKFMASSSPKEEDEKDELLARLREMIKEELAKNNKAAAAAAAEAAATGSWAVGEARIDDTRGTLMETTPSRVKLQSPKQQSAQRPKPADEQPVTLQPQVSQEDASALMALMESDADLDDYDAI